MYLLCIITGLNPTIIIFPVALLPTRPVEETPTHSDSAQINDTAGIMRENIMKVEERGKRLVRLQDEAGAFPPFPNNNCSGMTPGESFDLCYKFALFMHCNR